jgi:DNA-binding MarR family transcriptional regulator
MNADLSEVSRRLADIDRLIHEPARLMIVAILSVAEGVDFLYLQRETGLTKGNLSSHLNKLEEAGYVEVEKTYRGKIPLTILRLTETGRAAFAEYRNHLKQFVDTTS